LRVAQWFAYILRLPVLAATEASGQDFIDSILTPSPRRAVELL